ncbi:MAG TPA: PQQ-dependent sugar dehydrogenase [Gemmatimonadaceae bacterium]|nr:PQQ-dependent sugar dehydrogenase [Gemmatimonadaceae bacterium]
MSLRQQVRFAFAFVCSLVLLAGCEKSPTGTTSRPVTLHLSASGLVTTVNLVVVKVTAPDISVPLVFNFPVTSGSISGSIDVPAGSNRTITASAYDAGNTETHRGVVTMNLPAGTQPVLTLQLLPLTSTQPITITITTVVITLSQTSLTITVGLADPSPLTATIKDASGNPVAGATVKWATTDPGVATVDATTGQVHATGAGTAQIVATFAGVAAACNVTVFGGQTASLTVLTNHLTDPVYATAPTNDDRLFVVQRPGVIRLLKNGQLQSTPFLDLTSEVLTNNDELGMLSMAFHPNYAQNHQFYVLYTRNNGQSIIEQVARFTTSGNPDVANPASETPILSTVPRFTDFHNGGLLMFGPDGKLYIGFGDAGNHDNAQDLSSFHGKILRIDVDAGSPYAVPSDNPLVGVANAKGEIWDYGLRNPWRYSFDSATGNLYIGDVGENLFEEVDIHLANTPAGKNFGWPTMEGNSCFLVSPCSQTGLTAPVFTYTHGPECAIIGGFVYHGTGIQELTDNYVYSDLCSGVIRSFKFVNGAVTAQHDWTAQLGGPLSNVTSFGRDSHGELYIMTLGAGTGTLYKFVPGAPTT